MASKARFQQHEKGSSISPTAGTTVATTTTTAPIAGGKSIGGSGSASKIQGSTTTAGKTTKNGAGQPTTTSNPKGVMQVIYNGKIVTPMSLLPKKKYVSKQLSTTIATPENDDNNINEQDQSKQDQSVNRFGSNKRLESVKSVTASSTIIKKKQDENCAVLLCETPTEIIFTLTSLIAASDVREVAIIDDKNTKYENLIIAHKNPDGYTEHMTQTLNNPQRNQNEMAAPNALRDVSCQSTAYDINDEMSGFRREGDEMGTEIDEHKDAAGLTLAVRKLVKDTLSITVLTPGCLLDITDISKPIGPGDIARSERAKNKSTGKSQAGHSSAGHSTIGVSGNNVTRGGSSVQGIGHSEVHHGSEGHPSEQGAPIPSQDKTNGSSNESQIADSVELLRKQEAEAILSSKLLLKRLQMLERAVQQNAYQRQQLDYQDLPDIPPLKFASLKNFKNIQQNEQGGGMFGGLGLGRKSMIGGVQSAPVHVDNVTSAPTNDQDDDEPKCVKTLFSFYNVDLVQGRSVTSMSWNALNTDLLAVGYGKLDNYLDKTKLGDAVDEEKEGGIVLFWSLRNPEFPEKVLKTPFPVTTLDFSKIAPMTLAVGLSNGDVNIYDMKRQEHWETPVETSNGMHGCHTDPVWYLKWITNATERTETLVSISSDGKVLEWNLKKGLAVSTLMVLNRGGQGEGWITRVAAGISFDFVPDDLTSYIVGTEEGSMHRCSVSYNEQYLDTYNGHEGPVYRIKFSPKWPKIFLSCSSDWTAGLYHVKSKVPLIKMQATGESSAINDISWCPGNSTIFASITADAKLQIWDLSVSAIDPVTIVDTTPDDIINKDLPKPPTISELDNQNQDDAGSIPPTPAPSTSKFRRNEQQEEAKESTVALLLKKLSLTSEKRVLTTLLFGEKSPIIVVGDNRGAVTVYRILQPRTILNNGPLIEKQRLTDAILQQSDPSRIKFLLDER